MLLRDLREPVSTLALRSLTTTRSLTVIALGALVLGGCSIVIDSSKYVGDGTDGGTADGAIVDGAIVDGSGDGSIEPPTVAPFASVALGDYAPMPGDAVDVLFGPSSSGPVTTLEWSLDGDDWATVVQPSIPVPASASAGTPLFVRATWNPSAGEPIVRRATAIVQARQPSWARVLPDIERAGTAFWDPKNQRWVFAIDSLGQPTWWELAVVEGGHPRLVALPTPEVLADPRDGFGFVAVPDLANDRLLLIGGAGPRAEVIAMSLASAGPLTISEVGLAGTGPMAMQVAGATFVPSAEGDSVLVCGGFLDADPPMASDVCASLRLPASDTPTWTEAPSLPSALGGVTLFHAGGDTYAFGGLDFTLGVSSRLFRLAGDAWEEVDAGLVATDARGNAMAAQVGDRVSIVGGAVLEGTDPARAPGRLVLDFATSPPTVTRDASELPGGVNGAVGTVGTTLHVYDGSEPNDSAPLSPVAFRRVASDGTVTPVFVFGETTPPPRVVALAGWNREGTSFVYGGGPALAADAEGGAWTFEDGVRPMPLEGTGPEARSDLVIDTRANAEGFPWTLFGGVRGDGIVGPEERTFWLYEDRWDTQTYVSGGPVPRRGANVTRTQGCGPAQVFLFGGQDGSGNPSGQFEAWGCDAGTCSWYSDSALPTLPAASYATLTWDGDRTLILLGGRASGGAPIAQLRVLDHCLSSESAWRDVVVDDSVIARFAHTTTVLGSDATTATLLVAGGLSSGGSMASSQLVELVDVSTDAVMASVTSTPMGGPEERAYHTALRSREGDRVWIVGGQNGSGRVLGDAWVLRYPTSEP